jgi:hypothetical protein
MSDELTLQERATLRACKADVRRGIDYHAQFTTPSHKQMADELTLVESRLHELARNGGTRQDARSAFTEAAKAWCLVGPNIRNLLPLLR